MSGTTAAYTTGALPGGTVDAVVIGGGAAGLNGALMLARSRRPVVVIDSGAPRNAHAEAVHGLLGLDGTPPAELYGQGREEVRRYGGPVAEVVRGDDGGITGVRLADGQVVARRVLAVATTMRARTEGLAGPGLPMEDLPDGMGRRFAWRSSVHRPDAWPTGSSARRPAHDGVCLAGEAPAESRQGD